jgi:hypothetical protein
MEGGIQQVQFIEEPDTIAVCSKLQHNPMRHLDDTHTLVADFCWRATMAQDNLGGDLSLADFITLKEAMVPTRSNYLHLLTVGGVYQGALKGKEHEVDKFTH